MNHDDYAVLDDRIEAKIERWMKANDKTERPRLWYRVFSKVGGVMGTAITSHIDQLEWDEFEQAKRMGPGEYFVQVSEFQTKKSVGVEQWNVPALITGSAEPIQQAATPGPAALPVAPGAQAPQQHYPPPPPAIDPAVMMMQQQSTIMGHMFSLLGSIIADREKRPPSTLGDIKDVMQMLREEMPSPAEPAAPAFDLASIINAIPAIAEATAPRARQQQHAEPPALPPAEVEPKPKPRGKAEVFGDVLHARLPELPRVEIDRVAKRLVMVADLLEMSCEANQKPADAAFAIESACESVGMPIDAVRAVLPADEITSVLVNAAPSVPMHYIDGVLEALEIGNAEEDETENSEQENQPSAPSTEPSEAAVPEPTPAVN
ncbi:MAG: hypothetical protein AAGJ54_05775 [Planctomycetota bacterium]